MRSASSVDGRRLAARVPRMATGAAESSGGGRRDGGRPFAARYRAPASEPSAMPRFLGDRRRRHGRQKVEIGLGFVVEARIGGSTPLNREILRRRCRGHELQREESPDCARIGRRRWLRQWVSKKCSLDHHPPAAHSSNPKRSKATRCLRPRRRSTYR